MTNHYFLEEFINHSIFTTSFSISTSASSHVLHSYASATLAVFIGGGLAFAYTKYLEKTKTRREVLSEFSSDLNSILRLCEDYWLGDHSNKDEKVKLEKSGHILASKILATTEYRPLIKKLMKKSFNDFESLDVRLFMLATGGGFQTRGMASSPETYAEISTVIYKTELILRELRS